MKKNFYSNGLLIQEKKQMYVGFDGLHGQDVWPLYFEDLNSDLNQFLNKSVFLETMVEDWVDLCTDINFIKKYYKECQDRKMDIDILFCRTSRKYPAICQTHHDFFIAQSEFLGFDYAYPGFGYYSAVFEDIFTNRIMEFNDFQLNSHGLFQKLKTVRNFSQRREVLIQNSELNFEQGNFIIYEIWRVEPQLLSSL